MPNITFGYNVDLSQSTFPAESVTKEITRVNFKLNNVKSAFSHKKQTHGVFQFYHLAAGMPPREHTVKLNLPSTPFTRSRSDIFAILAKSQPISRCTPIFYTDWDFFFSKVTHNKWFTLLEIGVVAKFSILFLLVP